MSCRTRAIGCVLVSVAAVIVSNPSYAQELEWKYFSERAVEIERGAKDYAVCAAPNWPDTASDKAKSRFVFRKKYPDYPAVPDERWIIGTSGYCDIVGVNWTEVKSNGQADAFLEMIEGIARGNLLEVKLDF